MNHEFKLKKVGAPKCHWCEREVTEVCEDCIYIVCESCHKNIPTVQDILNAGLNLNTELNEVVRELIQKRGVK